MAAAKDSDSEELTAKGAKSAKGLRKKSFPNFASLRLGERNIRIRKVFGSGKMCASRENCHVKQYTKGTKFGK